MSALSVRNHRLAQLRINDGDVVGWRRDMRLVEPRRPIELHGYISGVLGFHMPVVPMAPGHAAPFDYVQHAFFESESDASAAPRGGEARSSGPRRARGLQENLQGSSPARDCMVWANRGGGKTQLGAIATLLDMLFKPGIQIRILGGSFEQSSKMYGYLKRMLDNETFHDLVAGQLTQRHVQLTNGSRVEVLSQSQRAVRGQRVHKLRCDEVELFEPDVWEAAQLVTRSGWCGDKFVRGCVEALSTMHRPYGLMNKLLNEAHSSGRRIFRWSVLDTLEHCPPQRSCEGCKLWNECGGRAKLPQARGFVMIDDAIAQKHRVGLQVWQAEMLCERPNRSDSVYPEFDAVLHVFDDMPAPDGVAAQMVALHRDASAPIVRFSAKNHPKAGASSQVIGGIDFGYAAPTALLFALVDEQGSICVIDEFIEPGCTTQRVLAQADEMAQRRGRPEWIGADPAGHQRSDQTGTSTISLWKRAGWNIRTCHSTVPAGVQLVRAKLLAADGSVRLRIHTRCEKLIEAMTKYRYKPESQRHGREAELPVKDGNDHACDALRYVIVNLQRDQNALTHRKY